MQSGADPQHKNSTKNNYLEELRYPVIRKLENHEYKQAAQILTEFKDIPKGSQNKTGTTIISQLKASLYEHINSAQLEKLIEMQHLFGKVIFSEIISKKDSDGKTALHHAAKLGFIDIVKYLVTCGLYLATQNNSGSSSLDYLSCATTNFIKNNQLHQAVELMQSFPEIRLDITNSENNSIQLLLAKKIVKYAQNCNELELVKIKSLFGDEQFKYFINVPVKDNETALTWAAYSGHTNIVNFLLLSGASSKHENKYGRNYLQEMSFPLIKKIENGKFAEVRNILSEFKDIPLHLEWERRSVQKVMGAKLIELSGKSSRIELNDFIKYLSPFISNKINIAKLPYLIALEKAIKYGNVKMVKELVTSENINSILPLHSLGPLGLAEDKEKDSLVNFFLKSGALVKSKYAQFDRFSHVNSRIDGMILNLTYGVVKSKAQESKHIKILNLVSSFQDELKDKNPDIYQKLDLYIVASQILEVILAARSDDISSEIKDIFLQRESAVKNTRLDYCYDLQSVTNKFCIAVAKIIQPKAPYNLLMQSATTKGRDLPWYDPILGIEETILPEAKAFFRTAKDEIHLYEYIVDQAIALLRAGNKLSSTVWFGTDPKITKPVPPLTKDDFVILKQRSPALRKLVEYTEQLDSYTKFYGKLNVYESFNNLKTQLYAGDYRSKEGSEYHAGGPAYVAIAEFAEWWNQLKCIDPALCKRIRKLGLTDEDTTETLGEAIDILLDNQNFSERGNTTYCVNLKANMISRIISDEKNQIKLIKMQFATTVASDFKVASSDELKQMGAEVLADLKESKPKPIIAGDLIKLPPLDALELNLLLMSAGVMKEYKDFVNPDLSFNHKTILKYIFAESNNRNLYRLREMLTTDKFKSLRDIDYAAEPAFSRGYYAFIEGERKRTSIKYSSIESALAAKLVKNATTEIKTSEEAKQVVTNLYKENKFMSCNRRSGLNWRPNNKYLTFFNGSRSLTESRQMVEDKFGRIALELK